MRVSLVLETQALLPQEAPSEWDIPYLNLVVSGSPLHEPVATLCLLKQIEQEMGRDGQAPRWSPRKIDLDLLAWGDRVIETPQLTVPHPELMNRPFLLYLMACLDPDWRHPAPGFPYSGKTLAEWMHVQAPFDPKMAKCFVASPQLMGIVNITPDSFSDGGLYLDPEQAMKRIEELAEQGAAVIDLGAQSTRPGAKQISAEEEWRRLEPVLDRLKTAFRHRPIAPQISLDTFYPEVVALALKTGIRFWINDVTGGASEQLLHLAGSADCPLVAMHSLTVPPSKSHLLSFDVDPLSSLTGWAEKTLKRFKQFGIARERVIFDPGIGFGKSAFQSLSLLRKVKALKNLGCRVLVGHSRKSFLNLLPPSSERDVETIGVSHALLQQGADYLRVHNVEAHHRSLAASLLVGGGNDAV